MCPVVATEPVPVFASGAGSESDGAVHSAPVRAVSAVHDTNSLPPLGDLFHTLEPLVYLLPYL